MVFVQEVVVSVAKVSCAVLAVLSGPLRTASFSFHAFLVGDAEAANISNLDFFAELEIGARVRIRRGHLS